MSRSWLLTTGLILVTASYGTCDEVEATSESTTGQIQVAVEQFRESLGELESRVRRISGDEEQRETDQRKRQSAEKDDAIPRGDELTRHIRALNEQIRDAAAAGKQQVVQRLQKELHEYLRRAAVAKMQDTRDHAAAAIKGQIAQLESQIRRLREQGNSARVEELMDQLRRLVRLNNDGEAERERSARTRAERPEPRNREAEPHPRPEPRQLPPQEREELERRVHHLHTAAENLAAIGMHDLVERLRNEAEETERRLHEMRPPEPPFPREVIEMIHREFREIHEQIEQMHRELRQLKESHRE